MKVAAAVAKERPFKDDDTFLDFGAGPGITLEKIFYYGTRADTTQQPRVNAFDGRQSSAVPVVGGQALLVDISKEMTKKSAQLASCRCPDIGVFCRRIDTFDGDNVSDSFMAGLEMMPKLNCAISSLVLEYLTDDQIINVSMKLIEKLEFGGVLALFDWCEHYSYPERFADSIHHMRGFSKAHMMEIGMKICARAERPGRVEVEEREVFEEHGHTPSKLRTPSERDVRLGFDQRFCSKPAYRLRCVVDTFDVDLATTQGCRSGDAVHYIIIIKEKAAGLYPNNKAFTAAEAEEVIEALPNASRVGYPSMGMPAGTASPTIPTTTTTAAAPPTTTTTTGTTGTAAAAAAAVADPTVPSPVAPTAPAPSRSAAATGLSTTATTATTATSTATGTNRHDKTSHLLQKLSNALEKVEN
mmetsp:Transcript_16452/g.27813  ORF Transcript_16452/g.27813 Transcript_16452/m.27813 type:complete len:414 (+) Transcript_16452:225-1466(+)